MNIPSISRLSLLLLVGAVSMSIITPSAVAQRGDRDQDKNSRNDKKYDRGRNPGQDRNQRILVPRYRQSGDRQPGSVDRDRRPDRDARRPGQTAPAPRDYVLDRKYNHDRYYPPRGHVSPRLPDAYRVLVHRHKRYYYHRGVWYRRSTTGYIVVLPPIGVAIPVLPPFYTVLWVGGIPYYYANGIYYVWYPARQAYVVTSPPPESAISDKPAEPEKLFIYPKKGQSEEQQAEDRYQCHRWAVEKSDYDPTRAGGNVPEDEYFNKRSDYQRAMKACLEAREYSVK